MKRITTSILTISILLNIGCSTSDKKTETNKETIDQDRKEPIVTFDNEPELKIDSYFIDPDTAKHANQRFYDRHRVNPGQSSTHEEIEIPLHREIKMAAIKELYEKVKDRPAIERTVNGIEIHYGFSNGKKLTTYYQTWYLDSLDETKDKVSGIVRRDDSIYQYDADLAKFVPIQTNNRGDLKRYSNWLRIKEKDPNKRPPFRKKNEHDPNSILFSFQELFLLYHRNNEGCWIEGEGPGDSCNYDGYILQMTATKWDASRNEHSLMFKYGSNDFVWPDKGTVGNLAHICPPNCNGISYP